MWLTFELGVLLGLSIIISIGAQNIYVIQQALKNEYTYVSVITCILCDVILILSGVAGLSVFFSTYPALKSIILVLGILFLGWYGYQALRRCFTANTAINNLLNIASDKIQVTPLSKIILLGLSFSLLNPASILDTIVIIGGSANHYDHIEKYLFVAGTITASCVWFFSLGATFSYLARRPISSKVWRALDFISGSLMLGIAINFMTQLV